MSELLEDPKTNIIAVDPSMLYTGLVVYKPHKIVEYHCIRKKKLLEGQKFDGVMNTYSAYQKEMSKRLIDILRFFDPDYTHLVMEQPTGSQSTKAAWGMAMSSSLIIAISISMFRKYPFIYKERDAKMHMFQTATVPKERTMKYMWAYWRSQGIQDPNDQWKNETNTEKRACMEGVADAMLILNLHLHKLNDGLDIQKL